MSRWTSIHKPLKWRDGHRIARSDTGLISLYDYSGNGPEFTDDGPLIVRSELAAANRQACTALALAKGAL